MASAHNENNHMLDAALALAEGGWPVFPCNPETKAPLTPAGFNDATVDPVLINRWWARNPGALIGVPTGGAIGAWVLDIDDPGAFEAACDIALPRTRCARTGKGYHLYFEWDPAAPIHNLQRTKKGWPIPSLPGAEVRGDGGYVIVPPSIHPNGKPYVWDCIEEASEAPDELVARIKNRKASVLPVADDALQPSTIEGEDKKYGLAALKRECDSVSTAGDGEQEATLNEAALKIGGLVAGGELSMRTAAAHLMAVGMTMPSFNPGSPWTPQAIEAKVKRGISQGMSSPRSAPHLKVVKRAPDASDDNQTDDRAGQPVIRIREGYLHTIATQAEDALILAEKPFYVRNGIVRPIIDDVPTFKNGMTKTARLKVVDEDTMVDHLSQSAIFTKFNQRKQADVRADPPRQVAATILSRDGQWRFKRLAGVITTPTMRPDGTILSQAGYDEATYLLLLDPPILPAMPTHPTRADAMSALEKLDDLLSEFPFVDDASRSVALSALITPVVRGAMPAVPLHITTAPAAGTGKSYIFDLTAGIAMGNRMPVFSAGKNEEELEKRLGGALLKGQPLISIDNVNGGLGGDLLCQAIERPIVDLRPLGGSTIISVDNRASMFATGNNIHVVGDMTRRVIVASLDANMERPENRQFKAKPFDMIMADRGGYIAAALMVARAYAVAGYPDELPALASFEDWSKLVRSALVWLGRTDPLKSMDKARAEDPTLEALGALFVTWYDADNSHGFTTGELKKLVDTTDAFGGIIHVNLRAALTEVASDRSGGIDPRVLGQYLGRNKGRIVQGIKLVVADDNHAKQKVWRVVKP